MSEDEFVNWDDFAEFKKNISFLKVVNCSSSKSCSFWRKGNYCSFSGEVEIGTMGTCLSMEPPERKFTVNRLTQKGRRFLP